MISTHVLDTSQGRPAGGVRVELFRAGALVASGVTNRDGRTDQPLLEADRLSIGTYELQFHVGEYYRSQGNPGKFLDVVPVRFSVEDAGAHYHVPLLCSPWSYTTYRGS